MGVRLFLFEDITLHYGDLFISIRETRTMMETGFELLIALAA